MSEVSESSTDLNEVVEEFIEDASVITVPIDDTLSNSGEAADAKAVGDALALKADKSELSAAINVNGQSADNKGKIILLAEHVPMADTQGADSVKDAIEAANARTAEDILMETGGEETVADVIQEIDEALTVGVTDEEIDAIFDDWDEWEE